MKKKEIKVTSKKLKSLSVKEKESKDVCGIGKQYLKSRPVCKVTFRLPKEAAPFAQSVALVGDFNGWDENATPMKILKNGSCTVCIELETNNQYRYRFLIDGDFWENDWNADKYEPNLFGGDDSVVII
ncbi:MAG: isoamylase early set domain-containing protein [Nitrospirae bacterium]|nr:isoamylase early set domain-containing protein [Nitrospirota bacterium]